jgi:hypothetical protein
VELNPEDQKAICIVAQIDELFAIDAQVREKGLSQEERQVLRLEKSKPLLEQIKTQIQAARSDALPKSVLAKACNYTLTLWVSSSALKWTISVHGNHSKPSEVKYCG